MTEKNWRDLLKEKGSVPIGEGALSSLSASPDDVSGFWTLRADSQAPLSRPLSTGQNGALGKHSNLFKFSLAYNYQQRVKGALRYPTGEEPLFISLLCFI